MYTRNRKTSNAPKSPAARKRVLAQLRARELAEVGRKTGLAPDRTPNEIIADLFWLVRRDGWTSAHRWVLGELVERVPDRSWRAGTCNPVVTYSARDIEIEYGSRAKLRNHLHALTAHGALWFENGPSQSGELGYPYHIDLAPLIVLEPKVRRRAREIQDEIARRGPLLARVRELRRQVRTLVEYSPPEGALPDEAAAFANELEEMLPTKYAIDNGNCALLEPLAESLTDLLERCRAWHLAAECDS